MIQVRLIQVWLHVEFVQSFVMDPIVVVHIGYLCPDQSSLLVKCFQTKYIIGVDGLLLHGHHFQLLGNRIFIPEFKEGRLVRMNDFILWASCQNQFVNLNHVFSEFKDRGKVNVGSCLVVHDGKEFAVFLVKIDVARLLVVNIDSINLHLSNNLQWK